MCREERWRRHHVIASYSSSSAVAAGLQGSGDSGALIGRRCSGMLTVQRAPRRGGLAGT
jgi:hypothetical protein